MAFWILLLLSLAAGAASRFWGLALGQALLVCLGSFVGLNLLFVLFWVIVASTVDDSKPIEKPSKLCRFGCVSICGWLCAWAGVHLFVKGKDLLPKEERFLLVCNHRSAFDPIVMEYALRDYDPAFISKPSNLKLPFIGRLAYGAGFLPINRENDREALKTILQAADFLKRGLCSIVVYPEGTRTKTGELLPFHAGSFKIAQRGSAPLVIASIRGTELVQKHFPFRHTTVNLHILEVLDVERVKAMSTQELSAYSREKIEADLREVEE